MGNLACTSHGAAMVIPAPAFDPEATLAAVAAERCTSLYGVPTMFIAELGHPRLRRVRPDLAADRDHGRLAVPGGGDEAGHRAHAHERGGHLLRDDRDLAGVDPDGGRRPAGEAGGHGGPGAAARRDQGRRPEPAARPWPAARAASSAPAATASCPATGTTPSGPPRRSTPTAGCTPATWPTMDDEGYVNIVGRIKDMVIRGGENVYPAGDRGVPLRPSRHRRRPGDRRARRALRRGADGLDRSPRAGRRSTSEAVRAFCQGRIAHYKIPRYVKLVDAFPMTVTGKVQKFKMREQAIEELGLSAPASTSSA